MPVRVPGAGRAAIVLGLVAMATGLSAAWYYHDAGLTLSHYDAKAHLVVARRVIDNITPGWRQIGAVWLPLPHLINLLPVQVDAMYRTGASGVVVSVAAFGLCAFAAARIVLHATGSTAGALLGVLVLVLNPNLLYLQATPMTEPLLLGLTLLGVAWLQDWTLAGGGPAARPGLAFALACMTRYEAWPVTAAALAAAGLVLWRTGTPARRAAGHVLRVAAFPALAIAWFSLHSRLIMGEWLVSDGFFVPENPALGNPVRSAVQVWWGAAQIGGWALTGAAGIFALAIGALVLSARLPSRLALTLAPLAAAALPWYAFLQGHPFRIRYMIPVTAAGAVVLGVGIGLLRGRRQTAALLLLAGVMAVELRPLDANAPMLREAQWDTARSRDRRRVTQCLVEGGRRGKIMASMGSLAHYMQETSHSGFALRDFLHEGNGDIWLAAIVDPRPFAEWILVEERSEGGDVLALRGRSDPAFFRGFDRICEGGGVALYRRRSAPFQNRQ